MSLCEQISQYATFTSCTLDDLDLLVNGLRINEKFLSDAIGIYQKSSDSLSINQLVDCPEAAQYAAMIHTLLWQNVAPLLLAISAGIIALRIVKNIFNEV